jgi:hypothetical protein
MSSITEKSDQLGEMANYMRATIEDSSSNKEEITTQVCKKRLLLKYVVIKKRLVLKYVKKRLIREYEIVIKKRLLLKYVRRD